MFARPDDRFPCLVNFHHEAFRFLLCVTEDPLQDEDDKAHEIHGIVIDNHIPRSVQVGLRFGQGDFVEIDSHSLFLDRTQVVLRSAIIADIGAHGNCEIRENALKNLVFLGRFES